VQNANVSQLPFGAEPVDRRRADPQLRSDLADGEELRHVVAW